MPTSKNLLGLGTLRLLAILAPIIFALVLGLSTDLILSPTLSGYWPEAVATLIVAIGAMLFSFFIFRLLRAVYLRIDEQNQSLALLEERERIGMDLHDGAIQSIYAVVLRLDDIVERLKGHPDEVKPELEKAMDDLNRVIQDIRSYIFDLRPEILQGDLERAIKDLVQGVRVNALIDAELAVEGDLNSAVTEDQAVSLFRIAQEALSNVSRHAQASSLQVKLTALPQSVRLEITDDGIGFDPQAERPGDRHGLRNIDERAHMLGAKLSVDSVPGSGTRVSVEFPVDSVRQ
ncbi:hypothetical protein LCGC14_1611800 [marine sediment metagenome]|uniref:Histidine kinase domain-containing protein n=1 Tax=marine sediment metagenome TaxID=412755 RepID=A0A0F9I815_9ZZZZ